MSFEGLGIQPWLCKQCQAMQLLTPTLIQKESIPPILAGKHLVGGALTGSGKTAAFALPILQILSKDMYGVFALVLTPSRELAYQILDQFIAFGAPLNLKSCVIIGGAPHAKQLDAIQVRPHVVVATPGRIKDLLEKFPKEVTVAFQNLRFLVLDEADRLTEGEMEKDVLSILQMIRNSFPSNRPPRWQTLFFTATVSEKLTNVKNYEELFSTLGIKEQRELVVALTSNVVGAHGGGAGGNCESGREDAAQYQYQEGKYQIPKELSCYYLLIPHFVKLPYLVLFLRTVEPTSQQCIVFANSCFRCEVVRLTLQLLGFPVASLNSLLTQQQRLDNLALFKAGVAKFLIATDIAARGLDIPNVDAVVHYDFPKLSQLYIHRVGRTARAGKLGRSIALVTEQDVYLIRNVEKKLFSSSATSGEDKTNNNSRSNRNISKKMLAFKDERVSEEAVMSILDEVSMAKVEAKLTIDKEFGDRAQRLKEVGREKKTETNRLIRMDGKRLRPPSYPIERGRGNTILEESTGKQMGTNNSSFFSRGGSEKKKMNLTNVHQENSNAKEAGGEKGRFSSITPGKSGRASHTLSGKKRAKEDNMHPSPSLEPSKKRKRTE